MDTLLNTAETQEKLIKLVQDIGIPLYQKLSIVIGLNVDKRRLVHVIHIGLHVQIAVIRSTDDFTE